MQHQLFLKMVSQYSHYLQVEKGNSARTIELYVYVVEYFFAFCAENTTQMFLPQDWEVTHLGERELEYFFNEQIRQHQWERNTQITFLTGIRSFFRFLAAQDYLNANPIQQFTFNRPASAHQQLPVSPEQVAVLFEELAEESFARVQLRLMLELLYGLGISPFKMARMKDFRIAEEKATISFTEDNRAHELPIGPQALACAQKYLALCESIYSTADQNQEQLKQGFLFVTEQGKAISPQKIRKAVKLALDQAGLSFLNSCSLRTLCTQHLAERGADIRTLQYLKNTKGLHRLYPLKSNTFAALAEKFHKSHWREK